MVTKVSSLSKTLPSHLFFAQTYSISLLSINIEMSGGSLLVEVDMSNGSFIAEHPAVTNDNVKITTDKNMIFFIISPLTLKPRTLSSRT